MIAPGTRIHLVGMGGVGVGALATLLRRLGAQVDGCDARDSDSVQQLRAAGIPCAIGHDPRHVGDAAIVVHTAAVDAGHPELRSARAAGAEVVGRGAFLARLMDGGEVLAVTGSHGKTTTTWFAGHLLERAGGDPTVIVGGTIASLGANVRCGDANRFVAEADESDGSFALIRSPRVAVVTNLDHEHLRHYGSLANLVVQVNAWLRTVPDDGAIVVPADGLPEGALDGVRARIVTCGIEHGDWHFSDLRLHGEGSRGMVVAAGRDLGAIEITMPGLHMAQNALMAFAAAQAMDARVAGAHLAGCERVRRRFTLHGLVRGVRVIEDYAHHPAEVRATIAAARLNGGRVHVLFQPHRHTRTADCFDAFVQAFDQAHVVAIAPIYAAGEAPIPGVDAARLADALAERRRGIDDSPVHALADAADGVRLLAAAARPGDTCLVLGAGDIGACAPALCLALVARESNP